VALKTKTNQRFMTKDECGNDNGFLVPIYNIHDGFFESGREPQQVYLTTIKPGKIKGPHLHYIRTGCFTCIKGNVCFILKIGGRYEEVYSGESYEYRTVLVPTGTAAALQNVGDEEAFVLNMPNPAWTPEMDDEYTADFSDYDFRSNT